MLMPARPARCHPAGVAQADRQVPAAAGRVPSRGAARVPGGCEWTDTMATPSCVCRSTGMWLERPFCLPRLRCLAFRSLTSDVPTLCGVPVRLQVLNMAEAADTQFTKAAFDGSTHYAQVCRAAQRHQHTVAGHPPRVHQPGAVLFSACRAKA